MHNQETELRALAALIPAIAPSFIDVGAEKGAFSRWLIGHGFTGIAIEPLVKHAESLKMLAAKGSLRFLNYGIDAEDGERDLHIATDEQGQPLDYFHSLQPLYRDNRVHHTLRERIICRSLGSLVREGVLPQQIGLLKIDTEGNDLRVIEGLGTLRAQILMVEYFTAGLYDGWADAAPEKLIRAAHSAGYVHCLAIRHLASGDEWISHQPLAFQKQEWGNLIFCQEKHFKIAEAALGSLTSDIEMTTLSNWQSLKQTCLERQALIERLHGECAILRNRQQ